MGRSFNKSIGFGLSGEGVTFAVQALILTNAALFAAQLVLDIALGDREFLDAPGGAIVIETLAYSNASLLRGWVWTPATYLVLHGGLAHLFWNMIQLYWFGPDVERLLGTRQFVRFYLFCGVAGALANMVPFALGRHDALVIGASGAILGVLVAFAITDPDREILLFPIPFPITARAMVIVIVLLNLLSTGGRVSVATHFGGVIAGFAYMKLRPLMLRWSWERRGRRVRKVKTRGETKPPPPEGEDEKRLADAIDNIFRFQDREKR